MNHDAGTHKTVYRKADGLLDSYSHTVFGVRGTPLEKDTDRHDFHHEDQAREVVRMPEGMPTSIRSTALVKRQILACARTNTSGMSNDDAAFPQFWSSAIDMSSLDSTSAKTSPALACYTAWIGRRDEDFYLVAASRQLYVQGLNEVQQAVNNPDVALQDETLSACIGLILYEALECPDQSYAAYHKHIDGCSALIKLRGPGDHETGLAHELFRGFRYICVSPPS